MKWPRTKHAAKIAPILLRRAWERCRQFKLILIYFIYPARNISGGVYNYNMLKIALLLSVAILFILGIYYYKTSRLPADASNVLATKKLTTRNTTIEVEVADTLISRKHGLSGKNGLSDNQGMLFVYDMPGFYSFWMKDMNFPIDIIWIDETKTIIGVNKNVSPDTFPETFQPPSLAKYILEVNAGWPDKNLIQIGDLVQF